GDLEIDVVLQTGQVDKDYGPRDPKGKGEQYGQRQDIALVLCAEQEVHKDQAQQKDQGSLATGVDFLPGKPRILVSVRGWQHFSGHFLYGIAGVPGTETGIGNPGYGYGIQQVEAFHQLRAIYFVQPDELAYGHGFPILVA